MRKAIVLGSVVALTVLGAVHLTGVTEPASHGSSPAFQTLLNKAIARLEGVPQQITAASVGEAHAEAAQELTMYGYETCTRPECWEWTYNTGELTCDPFVETCDADFTCTRFYTCDSQYTCHGEQTCNGCYTCWSSTCEADTMTCDGWSWTCDGGPDCIPYTFQGNYTCDGTPTCHETCFGWPDCGHPTGSDRTTWGELKKEFSE